MTPVLTNAVWLPLEENWMETLAWYHLGSHKMKLQCAVINYTPPGRLVMSSKLRLAGVRHTEDVFERIEGITWAYLVKMGYIHITVCSVQSQNAGGHLAFMLWALRWKNHMLRLKRCNGQTYLLPGLPFHHICKPKIESIKTVRARKSDFRGYGKSKSCCLLTFLNFAAYFLRA